MSTVLILTLGRGQPSWLLQALVGRGTKMKSSSLQRDLAKYVKNFKNRTYQKNDLIIIFKFLTLKKFFFKIYLLIYGCVRSSFLCEGFL